MDDQQSSRRSRSGRPDPADKRQLADHPVSLTRIAPLRAAPRHPRRRHRPDHGQLGHRPRPALPGAPRHRRGAPPPDVRLLVTLVLGMLAVAIATAAIGVVQTRLSTSVGQRVMHRLRSDLFSHLQRQSLGFFTRTRGGDVQSRLVNDIGSMQSVVTSTATSIAANVTVVVGTAAAMVALSWRPALLSLIVIPPAVFLTRQVARMRHKLTSQRQR
ncbi:ABC transporter transmembrane domain-containing protein [Nocardioides sp. B-3]|uniref:ABC transporter transmembrane domain-containing protein n=1 Tax=Nocardioides sp. B-3 TaxID=2895565 RepID=UPI0021525134|nr:ABC transporter transmembrane domain-containing protein [Nocardioides sp. B-3]UUZ58870.1 hypothetical protein LP418_22820 [Nocardioides sp. B-3]